MNQRRVRVAVLLAFLLASTGFASVTIERAVAATTHVVRANHVHFVYPDSPETSNLRFPPNFDEGAVRDQLRTVIVISGSHRETLGQYLRGLHIDLSKVVTVTVSQDSAAIYAYR